MLNLILLSSLDRVFPQSCPEIPLTAISCFENEPLSFQAAFRLRRDPEGPRTLPVYARVESDLDISTYLVGYVPVLHTDVGIGGEPAPGELSCLRVMDEPAARALVRTRFLERASIGPVPRPRTTNRKKTP